MNIYAIYLNSSKDNEELAIVKQGSSLTAALFNIFWAIYNRMWLLVVATLLLHLAFALLEEYSHLYLMPVAQVLTVVIFGFFADELQDYFLGQQNFTLQDIVVASSALEAELKYLTRQELSGTPSLSLKF